MSQIEFVIDESGFDYQKCLQKLERHKKVILAQKLENLRENPWKEAIPLKAPLSNKHKVKFDNGNFRLIVHINFDNKVIKPCYIIPRRRRDAYEQIW